MTILLYDLAVTENRRPSPFCWRIKYALAHKGLSFDTKPVAFTDIPKIFDGRFTTVPILEDGERVVHDSWAIADYLDATYKDHPRLFATPTERGFCRFLEAWLFANVVPQLIGVYVKDIADSVEEKDRAYFRESREKRMGCTLEEMVAGREQRLPIARAGFEPIRLMLTRQGQSFVSGDAPGYADYMAVGVLLWVASVSTLPLLNADDPVVAWYERLRDMYDGLGNCTKLSAISQR